jgi:hypothetical protein
LLPNFHPMQNHIQPNKIFYFIDHGDNVWQYSYGLEQIIHWSPFLVKGWGEGQKCFPIFWEVEVKYS